MDKNYSGTIQIRGKGTGFVALPGFTEDVLIARPDLSVALDGDTVAISLNPKTAGERQTGRVTKVIERKITDIIGTVVKDNDQPLTFSLLPDNKHIHIRPLLKTATPSALGMKVVAQLSPWSDPKVPPEATISETLGKAGEHETEMQAIIRAGHFASAFPKAVADAATALYKNQATIFADALNDPKRRDFRDRTTFTIDPKDAKDFDDAISLKTLENGNYEIGIHIADVSHYVTENSPIDKEARERATSVYLVDRVIPMLPEVLSNDLCSLRPEVDRLAFSAVFEITPSAQVAQAWFGQTIINSNHRFTYEDAQEILDQGNGIYLTELTTLLNISRQLRKIRAAHGAIAFEQPEIKFVLDDKGLPIAAFQKHRTETMLLVEDFMLLANEQVATRAKALTEKIKGNSAFIYRIHDAPDPDKITELAIFLHALGYDLDAKDGVVTPKDIAALMQKVIGTKEENLISTATIRSMAKAIYSTRNIGHFGLAFTFYTHFTSPIRRYPDLLVHRLLSRYLAGQTLSPSYQRDLEAISLHATKQEIAATAAERDSVKFKQVQYLMNSIGKQFDAIITGTADWGIYVQEQETLAEGLVRLATMKSDFFVNNGKQFAIKGTRTGKTYRLGDKIKVILTNANLEDKQLDFALVEEAKK